MIRGGDESDLPYLLEMGRRFHAASGFVEVPFDDESVLATFRQLIASPDGVLLVADGGMAAALCYPAYFNAGHKQAQELFWWVDEDKRASGLGKALLLEMEAWARGRGAQSLMMVCLDTLDPERVGKLYERAGYRPSERNYIKRL